MKRYSDPYLAGIGLGLVLLASFVLAGRGLGASHQTGWTGLVADLIRGRPSADGVYAIGDLGRVIGRARP